jgi:tetratricopeptide (TPR) repeat protein
MGVVYRAEDPRLGRHVALKLVPGSLTADPDARQRLLGEARAASALDHPNVCTVHDIGETDDGRLYFVMTLYEGFTLASRIARGPLSLAETLAIAVPVARGLAHAHDKGVIHRDIKPTNIILPEVGEPKILDFGIARRSGSRLTRPGTRLGTLAYMSPEQMLGRAVDARSDVWSLGVVLCEAATGSLPFGGDDEESLLYAIVHGPPRPWPDDAAAAPPSWRAVLTRALAKLPEHRYQSMRDMILDLVAVQADAVRWTGAAPSAGARPGVAPPARPSGVATKRLTVGREHELNELREHYARSVQASGILLCVSGEPGLGKTTLIEDFLGDLSRQELPPLIARGRCSERLAGTEAYLPILEALDSLLHGEDRDLVLRALKERAPTWYVQIAPVAAANDPAFAGVLSDARVASQERLKRELCALLAELALRRPLVLFVDDVHWADLSTIDVLSYVCRRCDSMRLLTLAAYRPSDLLLSQHPFLDVQRELQAKGLCQELSIDLLAERDIASLLASEFGAHEFPAALGAVLYRRTEGNPLFATDLLSDLHDRGVIVEQGGRWILAQPLSEIESDFPTSTRGMIERKIERLDEIERRLLVAASVAGQTFDSATLAAVTGEEVDAVERRLDNLERVHRFVRLLDEKDLPDGSLTLRYSFAHALYQNALLASLRGREAIRLSIAVADALLSSHGGRVEPIALDLAYLYERGRQYERAAEAFFAAARRTAAVHANQEAVLLARRSLDNAVKVSGEAGGRQVVAAANLLGQLHLTLSRLDDAIADFERAAKTAAAIGDNEAAINARCAAALAHFNLKRMQTTRERATETLAAAHAAGSEVGVASAELVLGLDLLCSGDTDGAEQRFERSLPVLRRKGPPLHALEALAFAGLNHAWQLDYERADRTVGWTLEIARDLGVVYHMVMNLFVQGMARFNEGRLGEGFAALSEGMRLAEQNDETYWLSRYPNTLGWVHHELQDIDGALVLNREGARVARANGYGKPEANSQLNLAQHHLDVGELSTAKEHLDRAAAIFEEDVWFRWRYDIRLKAEIARYWLRKGDTKQAGASAAESLALALPRKARKHMAWAHKLLGDVAAVEERFAEARTAYEVALAVLSRHRCPTVEWKILLAAAGMASAYGDVPLAERYRARARRLIEALADSLVQPELRRQFLGSEVIRAALAS